MNADHHHDHEALARRAATALRDDVDRRVDLDAALARMLDDDTARVVPLSPSPSGVSGRPDRRDWLGAAAAVLVVGAGSLAFALTRDDGARVVPADATDPSPIETAPSTPPSVPATSAVPTDTTAAAPDTTPAPTFTTVVVPPASEVDVLAGLVPPEPLDPSQVPAWLPPTPVADPSQVRLDGFEDGLGTESVGAMTQVWANPSGRVLDLTVGLGDDLVTTSITSPSEVWPWDQARVVTSMADGYAVLELREPTGAARLWGQGFTSDELVSIARGLSFDGARWLLGPNAPADLVELHTGWRRTSFATRSMQWDTGAAQGELLVTVGMPDSILMSGLLSSTTITEVNGAPAMVTELGAATGVSWSPAPDVVVRLGYTGSVEETLALARSLEPVDGATWQAAGVLDTFPADGCDSYFFC
jgi:hypothetical protein